MNSPEASGALTRLRTALKPTSTSIKDFVLTETRINGRPFSFKNHEYQEKILTEYARPDIDLVIQKPSQVGVSEVIYRGMLAWEVLIPGFASAIVFPTKMMSNEVMATRINQVVTESQALSALISKDVDSSSVKMFRNNSILYALGASPNSKSTVINRPIRSVIADELARCDRGIVTALRSRQRHQDHKSSVYFSTPLFEGADIDLEMRKCGVVWEEILRCEHCNHEFFPSFFDHVRVPGYDGQLKLLKPQEAEDLDIDGAYLECPKCHRPTSYPSDRKYWVDTSTTPNRPKTGIKLSAFAMPKYVQPPDMVRDLLAYEDRNEFIQQVLGLPAAKSDTTMDMSRIVFETRDPGAYNVWGLDLGKFSTLFIATVTQDSTFVHTIETLPLSTLFEDVSRFVNKFNCLAGVVDFMPYSDIASRFVNSFPNCWAALYTTPAQPIPEPFKLKVREDEAIGNIKFASINKSLMMELYVAALMNGQFTFPNNDYKSTVLAHHETVRRIRDPKSLETRYIWVRPQGSKTVDHCFHTGVYTMVAARLMVKAAVGALPAQTLITKFRPTADI